MFNRMNIVQPPIEDESLTALAGLRMTTTTKVAPISRTRVGMFMNCAPRGAQLPRGFTEFLLPLHKEFTPRQQALATRRRQVMEAAHAGNPLQHLPPSEATESEWRIE